jgi:hypothetical protein
MRCFGLNVAALASRLPDVENALRWAAVWSAPWAVLSAVWLAHVAVPYFHEDGDGHPYYTYMSPDGRMHHGPPPGAPSAMVRPVAGEEDTAVAMDGPE